MNLEVKAALIFSIDGMVVAGARLVFVLLVGAKCAQFVNEQSKYIANPPDSDRVCSPLDLILNVLTQS